MKLLNLVQLPEHLLIQLQEDFPEIILYNVAGGDDWEKYLPEAAIIFGNCPVSLIPKAKNLQWLQIVSSGIDAYQVMVGSRVILTTAKGVHWRPLAEHLLFMMLLFSKNHRLFHQKQRAKEWYRQPDALTLLSGQKLGIIGFGGIARTLVDFVRPFQMEVMAVDKHPPAEGPENIEVRGLDGMKTLLETSDHIVIALPLTPETKGLLNAEHIKWIKPGAYLYNVSRGELIDEKALTEHLQTGKLGGAALDVFENEPLSRNSPLWQMENVVITPHIAGHYKGLREATFMLFRENLSSYLQDKPLKNTADFDTGY